MTGALEVVAVRIATPSRFLFFVEAVSVLAGAGPVDRRVEDTEPLVRWRLAGSNQRFTGVAATAVPGLAASLAEVDDLRAGLRLLAGEVGAVAPGRWTWTLHRPDGPALVRAPRLYGRRVDCRRSLDLFLAQVPTAGRDATLRQPGQRQVRPRRAPGSAPPDAGTGPVRPADTSTGGQP